MKEKRGFLAKLNARGLEQSVTEDQARHMAAHQGSRYMLVLEVHAGRKVVDEDGSETIHLIPDLVELVPTEHEERVRKFQRSLYMERPEQIGQRSIEGISDLEPTSEDAGAELDAVTNEYPEAAEGTAPWDGDPDAPLTPVEAETAPEEGFDDPEPDSEDAASEVTEPGPTGTVVQFTHQG